MSDETERNQNKSTLASIAGVFLLVTVACLHAAFQFDLWREFVVSEVLLVVSAVALAKLLRSR